MIITKNYILCTYNDNQITIVHFTRSKRHVFDKINKLEPKLSTIDLFGPNGRRLDKKVQTNKCGDLVIIFVLKTIELNNFSYIIINNFYYFLILIYNIYILH